MPNVLQYASIFDQNGELLYPNYYDCVHKQIIEQLLYIYNINLCAFYQGLTIRLDWFIEKHRW